MRKQATIRYCFLTSKTFLGFGFMFKTNPPFSCIEMKWSFELDLLFIRFWIDSVKK